VGIFRKSKSFEVDDNFAYSRNLDIQLRNLQNEVALLKRKLMQFEEETNRNRWAIRYSRRMAIMSNLLLGLWIFWSRFLKQIQKQKKSRLLGAIGMVPVVSPLGNNSKQQNSLNAILYEGYMKAISKSWVFMFAALLLTRRDAWKRNMGLALSSWYSLYCAIFSHYLPWTNYFNLFANLLYVTAGIWGNDSKHTNNLTDFLNHHHQLPPPYPPQQQQQPSLQTPQT